MKRERKKENPAISFTRETEKIEDTLFVLFFKKDIQIDR